MKSRRMLISVLAFAAGFGGAVLWPAVSSGGLPKDGKASEPTLAATGTEKSVSPEAGAMAGKTLPVPVDSDSASLLEEVLKATGLGRILLMTRFIQTANAAQLEEICRRQAPPADPFPAEITRLLWARWVEIDPEVVLRPPPPPTRPEEPWLALARLNPLKAMTLCPDKPQEIRAAILSLLARSDPALTRKFLAEKPALDPGLLAQVDQSLFFSGMGTDPASAMTEALKKRDNQFGYVFGDWLRMDPAAVHAWMAGITDPAERLLVRDAAFHSRVKTDPAGAVTEAEALSAGQERTSRLTEALSALAGRDPAAARARAEAIAAPAIRQRALAAIARTLISTNPAAAVDILRDLNWNELSQPDGHGEIPADGSQPEKGAKIGEELLAGLVTAEPRSTLDALAQSADLASAPMREAMKTWLALQPEEASTWLRELPSGPAKELGVRAITDWLTAGGLLSVDYPAALAWAQSSTGPGRREDMLRLAREWAKVDADAALAGVQSLPLPVEEKAPLLHELERMKSKTP